jgi:hypothetical protein
MECDQGVEAGCFDKSHRGKVQAFTQMRTRCELSMVCAADGLIVAFMWLCRGAACGCGFLPGSSNGAAQLDSSFGMPSVQGDLSDKVRTMESGKPKRNRRP